MGCERTGGASTARGDLRRGDLHRGDFNTGGPACLCFRKDMSRDNFTSHTRGDALASSCTEQHTRRGQST